MRRHFGSLLFVIKAFAVYERGSCLVLYDTGTVSYTHLHTTGSLYSVLARFAMTGLNLTKIDSRPLKEGNNGEFKYNFYLDFTGNVHHCDTLDLLCSLSQELPNFSFLGNYVEYDPKDEH